MKNASVYDFLTYGTFFAIIYTVNTLQYQGYRLLSPLKLIRLLQ